MELNIVHEVATLQRLTIGQLRQRFAELFGEATQASNRTWLIKRIAWRLQALAEGDLSERARQRAAQLARDADLRLNPPQRQTTAPTATTTSGQPFRSTNLSFLSLMALRSSAKRGSLSTRVDRFHTPTKESTLCN